MMDSQIAAHESIEIERKYDVAKDAQLPESFANLLVVDDLSFKLSAQYFDTTDFLLAKNRIALRRREGGDDAGWHIKIKNDEVATEFTYPLTNSGGPELSQPEPAQTSAKSVSGQPGSSQLGSSQSDACPPAARAKLSELTATTELEFVEVARIETLRRQLALGSTPTKTLCYLVDDRVQARDTGGSLRAWREWELELAPGATKNAFTLVEPFLEAAGAAKSLSHSKIGRAMGQGVKHGLARGFNAARLASLAVTDLADLLQAGAGSELETATQLRQIARDLMDRA